MDDEMRRVCEKYAQLSIVARIEDLLHVRDKYSAMKFTYPESDQKKIEEYYRACEQKLRGVMPKEAQLITPQIMEQIKNAGFYCCI